MASPGSTLHLSRIYPHATGVQLVAERTSGRRTIQAPTEPWCIFQQTQPLPEFLTSNILVGGVGFFSPKCTNWKVVRSLRYTSPTPNISCTAMPLFQGTMCESPFLPKRWTLESPEAFKSRPS